MSIIHQKAPFKVPVPDNKIIEEHFGNASIKTGEYSIARMVAPPGWSEPYQTPEFDEITIVVRGRKSIDTNEGQIILTKGESIYIGKGERIRYSNPFEEECEYISVCIPAFSVEKVNRE